RSRKVMGLEKPWTVRRLRNAIESGEAIIPNFGSDEANALTDLEAISRLTHPNGAGLRDGGLAVLIDKIILLAPDGVPSSVWAMHIDDMLLVDFSFEARKLSLVESRPRSTERNSALPHQEPRPECDHSPDFRSVNWFGTKYSFTPMQAVCLKTLWVAWEKGTPDVGDGYVLENAASDSERLPLVFRNHSAWGTMIVDGATKGTHR